MRVISQSPSSLPPQFPAHSHPSPPPHKKRRTVPVSPINLHSIPLSPSPKTESPTLAAALTAPQRLLQTPPRSSPPPPHALASPRVSPMLDVKASYYSIDNISIAMLTFNLMWILVINYIFVSLRIYFMK